jgi:hypothetical protein
MHTMVDNRGGHQKYHGQPELDPARILTQLFTNERGEVLHPGANNDPSVENLELFDSAFMPPAQKIVKELITSADAGQATR